MEGLSAAASQSSAVQNSAAPEVQRAVQYSVIKQVAELQKDMLSQLMESMGVGQNLNVSA